MKVLLTLAPSNFPIGLKDVLTGGNIPVVWTNTKYKMLYINMGHGDKIFTSPIQNRLIENSLLAPRQTIAMRTANWTVRGGQPH